MLTPMIGMEPTLGHELQPTTGAFGIRSENAGEFDAVLDDLLDVETEQPANAFLLLFPALPLAPTPQKALLSSGVEELGVEASRSQFQAVPQVVPFVRSTPPVLLPTPSDTGAPVPDILASSSMTTASEPQAAVEREVAEPTVQANVGANPEITLPFEMGQQVEPSPSLLGYENRTVLGGDFEPSVMEASSHASDAPPPSDGGEGVSPVSSARQGETLSSPLTSDRETAEPTINDAKRAWEPRRAPLGQHEDSRDHTSRVSALHPTPAAHNVTHIETSHSVQSVQPDWDAVEQVAQHIERMVYNRERDSITVRLDPPELGVIELRIQASGGEVQAWVSAERDLTRQLLQQTHQQLREQLESRGLQLTHFDVGGHNNPHFAQARPFRTPATTLTAQTHPSTATDSLSNYDGRWSVWV